MLSLMIVDDEEVIRESLAECVDWQAYGIEVAGLYENGFEALDVILDSSAPDIAIVDVKMPGLTGLELIEKIREIDGHTEFIILSGYGEFDFAQKAIRLGARRYLLKPASDEQLLESVLDAVESCEKKREVSAAMEEHKQLKERLGQDGSLLSLLSEEKDENALIQAVKSYVRQNLSDSGLSLKAIASQHVHVNVDYLSRLFVQATGEKFSHYLNRTRVGKAKLLLQKDSGKVYQVAEQVGLGHNPRYFGQVFKKYTGMTPSAYTERLASGTEGNAL